jgi:rSAM/selenodomain-associated transferase 1
VKTRLAGAVGSDEACALYRAFLRDLSERLHAGPWRMVWAMTPPGSRLEGLVGAAPPIHIDQRGGDLATRMRHCFEDLFAAGARRVVMIGADAPHVTPSRIAQAFDAVDRSDVVLVPTRDGGYCLVGMREAHDIFTSVAMGTERVCDQTAEACSRLGLTVSRLELAFDVDELADARALLDWLGDSEELPHSSRVLRRWRSAGIL